MLIRVLINAVNKNGYTDVEIEADLYYPLAIHKTIRNGKPPYSLTHVKSGLMIARFETKKLAYRVMRAIFDEIPKDDPLWGYLTSPKTVFLICKVLNAHGFKVRNNEVNLDLPFYLL